MKLFTTTFPTPFGPFSLAVDEQGALVATAFGDQETLSRRARGCTLIVDSHAGRAVRDQVLGYFAGDRHAFSLTLAPRGTPFQQRVWSALQRIPVGETRTYGQLAAQLGTPAASRAVGRANANNPICVVVPCHRVIGANGALTGFAFGVEIKQRLLEHERMLSVRSRAA